MDVNQELKILFKGEIIKSIIPVVNGILIVATDKGKYKVKRVNDKLVVRQ
jgi:hypothetical protein